MSDEQSKPAQPVQQQGGTDQPFKIAEQTVQIRIVDQPECEEIFADSILDLFFDGQTLRVEFGVTRLDARKPNAPLTARRYTSSRLVLSPSAAVDLINKMQQIGTVLAQVGIVKTSTPAETDKPR